jgi:hypothetical protein
VSSVQGRFTNPLRNPTGGFASEADAGTDDLAAAFGRNRDSVMAATGTIRPPLRTLR